MFFGRKAAAGNAWDFAAAPIRVTFNGGQNFVVPPIGGFVWSDWIEMPIDNTQAYILAFNGIATSQLLRHNNGVRGGNSYTGFSKALATSEADIVAPTGYTVNAGFTWSFTGIEVKDTVNIYRPMTLQSRAFNAVTVPKSLRLSLQVYGLETIVPNVDLIGRVSRDGGVTWTDVPLSLGMDYGTIRTFEGIADVQSQPVGHAVAWQAVTADGKNVIFSGAVEQFK